MAGVVGFTLVNYKFLPQALVLGESFLSFHPEDRFVVVVLDYPERVLETSINKVELMVARDLPQLNNNFYGYVTALDQSHLFSFIRPVIAEYLSHECDYLLCFDFENVVFGPLDNFVQFLNNYDLGVIPKRLSSLPADEKNPDSHALFKSGTFDSGLFGINTKSTNFIQWWRHESHLQEQLVFPHDASFLTHLSNTYASTLVQVGVFRDPTFGVAYWNFDERNPTLLNQHWTVGGRPLSTMHFKGFNPEEPYWASRDVELNPRFRLTADRSYLELFCKHAEKVVQHQIASSWYGDLSNDDIPYQWENILPGIRLTTGLRHVYRAEWLKEAGSGAIPPPSPFDFQRLESFFSWLEGDTILNGFKMQRFVLGILIDRPDLQSTFVQNGVFDTEKFAKWIISYGRAEEPVSRLARFIPPNKTNVGNLARDQAGVDVIGSFNSEHGLGEAGRLLVNALKSTSESVSTISYSPNGVRGKHPFHADNESRHRLTIIALNPEQYEDVWNVVGPNLKDNRYVIGQWFWELEVAPPWYRHAFKNKVVDELWAPTRFIESMLRSSAPSHIPIHYMPLPFQMPRVSPKFSLHAIGLEKKFTFLFTFDFGSVMKRKNPEGAIKAFKEAFQANEGAQLVVKSINGRARPREYEKLMWLRDGREDIILLDQHLDSDESASLIAESDCYVSLHRSEGLGLGMAEAMLLGKPVIATGYSGNLDFMNSDNSYLVPWTYTSVGAGANAYPSDALWAEPDLIEASRLMRHVFENQFEASALGHRARVSIEENFSAQVTGARMAARLEELR
jgi:glycosyltransferase involved in cell wall biosynthesis